MAQRGLCGLVLAMLLGLTSVPAHALTQAEEAAYAIIATGANIFYVPAKFAVAIGSIPVGGIAGALSGGDVRSAYAIWVPAMGGTYFLTNGHMDGSRPVEFFGYDYADRTPADPEGERTIIFDDPGPALYE